jgi:hypothetical protein
MSEKSDISTPAKRRKLPASKSPVWTAIGGKRGGLKLGYRKGARGGSWVAKLVDGGMRAEITLGAADDDGHASGAVGYRDAIITAGLWADSKRTRIAARVAEDRERPATVGEAVESYIVARTKRDYRNGANARHRLGRHALLDKALMSLPVERLTAQALEAWRERLPRDLAPATINRMLNDLRAALNRFANANWRTLPSSIKGEIQAGTKAAPNARRARQALLSDADVRRIVAAAHDIDEDLGM